MVKTALLVVVALTAVASGRPPPPPDDDYDPPEVASESDSPAFNMFGVGFQVAALPMNGSGALAMSIGLSIEHPVFRVTRVAAEYDWLWLRRPPVRQPSGMPMIPRPEDHGTGHRASLSLRRELLGKGSGSARMFIDGELGGTVVLANDNMTGVSVLPGVFTGVRFGYDIYTSRDSSPSRTFETAFLLRLTGMRDGLGVSFGLGMFWGN